MVGTPKKGVNGFIRKRVASLKPSPENNQLYRDTDADQTIPALARSIRDKGLLEPLIITLDNFIVSGHRRHAALLLLDEATAQCRVLPVRRNAMTSDDYMVLLREHNRQREKTFDEMVREKLVDVDPDAAVLAMEEDRAKRTSVRVQTIDIDAKRMKRHGISPEKRGMADSVLSILRALEAYLPVSLRAIHYRLLNEIVFRNTKKVLRYLNDKASYKDLSDLMTRMRLAGEISWDAICDETRPVTTWWCWRNASAFISEKADDFLNGYSRDLLQSQSCHFEIIAEKLTVQNFVRPVAMRYRMPMVIMRGNSGIDARYQIAQRFKASGRDKLFLFCLGDCDPDGDSIVETTLRSMRDDFCIDSIEATRVAMSHDQADSLDLPRHLEANTDSSNYKKFVAKHGRTDCYELEAVEPDVLQRWLDTSIRGAIDLEAFNYEVGRQRDEAAEIVAKRKAVLDLMRERPD